MKHMYVKIQNQHLPMIVFVGPGYFTQDDCVQFLRKLCLWLRMYLEHLWSGSGYTLKIQKKNQSCEAIFVDLK